MPTDSSESLGSLSDEQLRDLLQQVSTIAIVGWSDKDDRPSHQVAAYLHKQGYRILPVNPRLAGSTWQGQPVAASLLDIPEPVDIVDVFRRPEATIAHAREAVQIGAGTLWLQLGIINDEAGRIAAEGGLTFVQDRCTQIEHLRLIRGISIPGLGGP